jgi:3'-phosphoadenosine 5'-phosphosulfate sulfotransferase (PAPS reductase)/FAD synthetase
MLYRILEAHQMSLPNQAKIIFCNTGKEENATLDFVNQCSKEWGVEITWLEFAVENDIKVSKVVNYETASRNGEPFAAVIKWFEPSLPNGRARYCSSQMKTRTMHRHLKSLGWTEWDSFIGIRADEPRRVAKFRANPHPESKYETVSMPLVPMGVSSKEVGNFWANQTFDLGLPNINGKTMHGNCDLCMLKPKSQVLSLIKEKPERALWWMKQEEEAAKRCHGDGKYFAIDRPSYAQMHKYSFEQDDMFDQNEEGISCFCGD